VVSTVVTVAVLVVFLGVFPKVADYRHQQRRAGRWRGRAGRAVRHARLLRVRRRTGNRIADLGERAGVTFRLENRNTAVDHPGVPFAHAADTLALVAAVDPPGLRMLDLYHAQIGEGNLIELLGRAPPFIGEINYPAIARALEQLGHPGTVGLEAWASGDSRLALERFRAAFTTPAA
jgi:hydroxypyruvate isomerase